MIDQRAFMKKLLRRFEQGVTKYRTSMRRFLSRVEKAPPEDLDAQAVEWDKAVWAETDCLQCSNCCRRMSPTYTFTDIKRIAEHLRMSPKQFKEKWLYKTKDGDWMNTSQPCQFLDLKTNMCNVYEVRPLDCAGFPHLTKSPMPDYIHVHKQNVQYCPATFKFVQKMHAALYPHKNL